MELETGLKFVSKWFAGLVEIVSIDKDTNTLSVEIYRGKENHHSESWILSHTIIGFENGDYSKCCDNCTDINGQNIGNMYVCPHCGRLVS